MVEREFMETVDIVEEGGNIVGKVGGSLGVITGGVILGGRGGTNSKGIFHRSVGINYVVQRFVGSMVGGGNTL